jgi:hypothetical protein
MPSRFVRVRMSLGDMGRLLVRHSGLPATLRVALATETRTRWLRHGFESTLTENEARRLLAYLGAHKFPQLALAVRKALEA